MKKITLLSAALLLAFMSVAQRHAPEFGLKGGVNLANLKMSTGTMDTRTGYHAGALAHFHLSPHFALQPEVMFSSQGAELNNVDRKLNYVNVPVLGQYMFGNGFRLQTGPQLGVRVNKNVGNIGDGGSNSNNLRDTDFSWSFGTGYLTRSGLGFDARYNHGLRNISTNNNANTRNRVWQLGLFYQFRK